MAKVQHSCEFYRCSCVVDPKGKFGCVSKAIHVCNHRERIELKLNKDEVKQYMFVFEGFGERMTRLKEEHEMFIKRFEAWEGSVNNLWAEINSFKAELSKRAGAK